MKRYAIVRLGRYGSCVEEFVCSGICKKCNYGDTKEQLISKVEQIIRRPIQKGDLELKSKGFKYGVRRLAKEIVEFLGVEE